MRVLSWNVSEDAFIDYPADFRAVLLFADADVVILDEVSPDASLDQLKAVLPRGSGGADLDWNISIGASGGRQRGAIASRLPLTELAEFQQVIEYPMEFRDKFIGEAPEEYKALATSSMDGGIAVHAVVVAMGDRRAMVVALDLQCCGDTVDSWQEWRRRIEARLIRETLQAALTRTRVDAMIIAGDLNLIQTATPLTILSGPYPGPISGLTPADVYHQDGVTSWTWDGRGTPFPSRPLDFQLYSPAGLTMHEGLIIDSEDMSAVELERHDLEAESLRRMSDHRPISVHYRFSGVLGWQCGRKGVQCSSDIR
jgi:endonuclease/exonuclease/phosphatase family metal-dependent hydrolase